MAKVIFVSARSIDGTVYWAGTGWASSYVGAQEIRTVTAASHAIAFLQANASPDVGPDEAVGQFAIHVADRSAVDAAYAEAQAEDADREAGAQVNAPWWREKLEVAEMYLDDGAHLTAADRLEKLAGDLRANEAQIRADMERA